MASGTRGNKVGFFEVVTPLGGARVVFARDSPHFYQTPSLLERNGKSVNLNEIYLTTLMFDNIFISDKTAYLIEEHVRTRKYRNLPAKIILVITTEQDKVVQNFIIPVNRLVNRGPTCAKRGKLKFLANNIQSDPDLPGPDIPEPRFTGRINFPR
eukprot:sb/3473222/